MLSLLASHLKCTVERISFIAALALLSDLQAMITVAPAANSCLAVSLPMPVFDPVIMITFPTAVFSRDGLGPVIYFFLVRCTRNEDNIGDMMAGATKDFMKSSAFIAEAEFISPMARKMPMQTMSSARRREMDAA